MHPPFEQSPTLTRIVGIRHGFFGRRGGVSDGDFASLNASRTVGDDTANVVENVHRAVMALKGGPIEVALGKQVHGTGVHIVEKAFTPETRPEADALVTTRPGIALGILTADCAPVLFADPEAGVIGAAHAGWKGAVSGILARTVEAMESLGATRSNIVAAIGPAISAENYEIGEEMATTIRNDFPQAAAFIVTDGWPKPHFDVPGLVRHQAEALGLKSVEAVGACTYAHPDLYFSHRYATHNGIGTGRQIALIARG
ncbi:peptidoglycan editing factor PgeF [Pelagibacterium sp. 26DY04]|uniref:peptidoglycan editing factor PgeF n=1 Tax=Pelagibacterium sp. 26DY04 TaxID=2967130 RepID=UPI0028153D45|nr:peptidoglycan editing factor PgeF [Pelagibacterium sp. 26DY04]WMT86019.1 peptidoglycan editing factor PgeF [Pelagibacterium sp. 26DY04]